MRELLVVFYGNELALGVILANWLLWTALGATLLGRWAMRSSHPRKLVAGLQVLVAFALPVTLLAARASKGFWQSVPGEILGARADVFDLLRNAQRFLRDLGRPLCGG